MDHVGPPQNTEPPSPHGMDAVLRQMIALREARIVAQDARLAELGDALAAKDHEIAARDAAITARDHEIAARDGDIAALNHEIAALKPHAAQLARLVHTLEWTTGPRALRAVLPAARLIRRLMRR